MKTILVDANGALLIKNKGVYTDMFNLLETYPNRKIIVSNVNDEEKEQFGFVNLPYEFFSLKHNPDKTDPKYFQTLLSTYNLTKDDVIHFDHISESVESAKTLGILSYFYNSETKDMNSLKAFLDSNI